MYTLHRVSTKRGCAVVFVIVDDAVLSMTDAISALASDLWQEGMGERR
jgi:hypothetical protein